MAPRGAELSKPGTPGAPDDLMLRAFDDLQFTLALEQMGITSQPVDDPTNMLRCIDAAALSRRLGVPMRDAKTDQQFLQRRLPSDGFVFWRPIASRAPRQ